MKRFILPLAALLILSGSLGLKTLSDCDNDQTLRDSEIMHCYGAAAITYAYAGDRNNSIRTCEAIWLKFGAPIDPAISNDMRDKAAMTSNSCYQNIASILADPDICYYIEKKSGPDTQLFGETTSRELCVEQAGKQLALQQYYNNNANICSMVFILPLLVFGYFRFR